jgi:hypothetical protein
MSKFRGAIKGKGDGKQGGVATDRGSGKATVANEAIRLSSNLELAINGKRTEVAINRTDNGACFIDIEIVDGKLEIVYRDESQKDY